MAAYPPYCVIFGGLSEEHEVSLRSGEAVCRSLRDRGLEHDPVLIHRDGRFEFLDVSAPFQAPPFNTPKVFHTEHSPQALLEGFGEISRRAYRRVFLALHGAFGEDGQIQSILETLQVPFVGSGAASSALMFDKALTKKVVSSLGYPMAADLLVRPSDAIDAPLLALVQESVGFPCFVKPNAGGSSVGVSSVKKANELLSAVMRARDDARLQGGVLIEETIQGRELTVGVRGTDEEAMALSPILISAPEETFFDYESKYKPGASQEICPAPIGRDLTNRLQSMAIAIHRLLRCRDFSRIDFMERQGIPFFLEVNTLPGLTEESLFPQMLRERGSDLGEFVERALRNES